MNIINDGMKIVLRVGEPLKQQRIMAPAVRAKCLRFSEETNALDYLIRAGQFIKETEKDLSAWKWVVLALHGSLWGHVE